MALVSSDIIRGDTRFACGARTGTRTAADFTISVGFAPKKVRVVNLTDKVQAEYWVDSNLDSTSGNVYGLVTAANGDATYAVNGISVDSDEAGSGRSFTVTVATASLETDDDDVVWECWG